MKEDIPCAPMPALDRYSTRWWFYAAVALVFFVPPLAQRGFTPETWSQIISSTLANAWFIHLTPIQPYLRAVFAVLLIAALIRPARFMGVFNGCAALSFFAFALLQNTAHTARFGHTLVLSNFLWFSLVGIAWAFETIHPAAEYGRARVQRWHAWAVPLAFIAFWGPAEAWAFHPKYLLWSYSTLAFCLMTPAYLCVHTSFHPHASPLVLRVTGYVGTVIACLNMVFAFGGGNVYTGVMHIPLLLTSVLALALVRRQQPRASIQALHAVESAVESATPHSAAITVQNLTKTYGVRRAVDDVSFTVAPGEIFGLLGPNGAGKTTTVECVAGLRSPDGGYVDVLGLDPVRVPRALRNCLGIQLQKAALPEHLTVEEAVHYFSRFHRAPLDGARLLDQLDLASSARTCYSKLSGGQKQRLHFLLALLGDPAVLIADEPTTGLDPCARQAVWHMIAGLRDRGKSIILTTHFMDEAETLCNRIAFIREGRIAALNSPSGLIDALGWRTRIAFRADKPLAPEALAGIDGVLRVSADNGRMSVFAAGPEVLHKVMAAAQGASRTLHDLQSRDATLEDVFVALAGPDAGNLSRTRDAEHGAERPAP